MRTYRVRCKPLQGADLDNNPIACAFGSLLRMQARPHGAPSGVMGGRCSATKTRCSVAGAVLPGGTNERADTAAASAACGVPDSTKPWLYALSPAAAMDARCCSIAVMRGAGGATRAMPGRGACVAPQAAYALLQDITMICNLIMVGARPLLAPWRRASPLALTSRAICDAWTWDRDWTAAAAVIGTWPCPRGRR